MSPRTIYQSSNGDDWLLATDADGGRTVIHRANASSGGRETILPLDEFLERDGGSPEVQAVRAALRAGPQADVAEGGTHKSSAVDPDDPTTIAAPGNDLSSGSREKGGIGSGGNGMTGMEHLTQEQRECVEECLACYRTCLSMASGHCLPVGGRHVDPTHFRLMLACAETCRATAHVMLLGLAYEHKHLCRACAEICTACASSCDAIGDMQDCVDACRRCADACKRMAA